jgi:hypothetical protein
MWAGFGAFVVALLLVDLVAFGRRGEVVPLRRAAAWSLGWTLLGLSFGGLLWLWEGERMAGEYLAGMIGRFRYLNLGLAAVLVFVGAKMALADVYAVPVYLSLAVIVAVLAAAVAGSWVHRAAVPAPSENRPSSRSPNDEVEKTRAAITVRRRVLSSGSE